MSIGQVTCRNDLRRRRRFTSLCALQIASLALTCLATTVAGCALGEPAEPALAKTTATLAGNGTLAPPFESDGTRPNTVVVGGNAHTCAIVNGGVQCWGANSLGQLGNNAVSSSFQRVDVVNLGGIARSITAGSVHTCAVVDGSAKCWGSNDNGQLGNNTSTMSPNTVPVQVEGLTSGVQSIAGGDTHTCALVNGGVKCWGNNASGQLGNDNSDSRFTAPVNVAGLSAGVQAIATGGFHSCALVDGGVQCWGANDRGQLGVMGPNESRRPIASIPAGARAITAGQQHTCALVDGGVWCWGDNSRGQLGLLADVEVHMPARVANLTDVLAIAAGWSHTCALVAGGALKCWGNNDSGQLGNDSSSPGGTPVTVRSLEGAQGLAAGYLHTCGIAKGGLYCWGSNSNGQLSIDPDVTRHRTTPANISGISNGVQAINVRASNGRNGTCAIVNGGAQCWGEPDFAPTMIASAPNGVTAIAGGSERCVVVNGSLLCLDRPVQQRPSGVQVLDAGRFHLCAVVNGAAMCWGDNLSGEIGDGTIEFDKREPTQVVGLTSGVQSIVAGTDHSCALVNGGVQCWGSNGLGQLARFPVGDNSTTPVPIPGLGNGVTAIVAGDYHTCALINGGVKCWGLNSDGEIGNGTADTGLIVVPTTVLGLERGVQAISAGSGYTCALVNGEFRCWGRNPHGEFGNGTTGGIFPTPVRITSLPGSVQNFSAGWEHTCAIFAGGGLRCWGNNEWGELGNHTTTSSATPVVVTPSAGFETIVAGDSHTCAIVPGGVRCWGKNTDGQLGNASRDNSSVPVVVQNMTGALQAIAAGFNHTCAIVNGGLLCWGDNSRGQLGDGTFDDRLVPVAVPGLASGVEAVAAGQFHTCALARGDVWCWGENFDGQLGDGIGDPHRTPFQITDSRSSGTMYWQLVAGERHTCALGNAGMQCWGNNLDGQLGIGSSAQTLAPASVRGQLWGPRLAAGATHTCGSDVSTPSQGGHNIIVRTLQCWGNNTNGKLGTGNTTSSQVPVLVTGMTTSVSSLSSRKAHTCVATGGAVKCWGENSFGQLGNGQISSGSNTPVSAQGLTGPAHGVAAGTKHTCAIENDRIQCWGSGPDGQLGNGTQNNNVVSAVTVGPWP